MAKKKRRRRVDESTSEDKNKPAQTLTERDPLPQQQQQPTAESPEVGMVEEGEGEEDGDDEDDDVGGVVMPPLPSELGMNAVRTAQVLYCAVLSQFFRVYYREFCTAACNSYNRVYGEPRLTCVHCVSAMPCMKD